MDWTRLKTVVRWLLDHWYIPFTVVAAAVSYGLLRRGASPQERLQVELDAVSAKRQVTNIALEKGAKAAHAHVAQVYAQHLQQLTEDKRHEADQLQNDPAALAAFLVRVGTRLVAHAAPPDASGGSGTAAPDTHAAAEPKPPQRL